MTRFHAFLLLFCLVFTSAAIGADSPKPNDSQPAAYPLKLSANHRYLVDQKNHPFLIVGDSPQG